MITVAVYINNQPIILKTARNMNEVNSKGETVYMDESGNVIWHKREDSVVKLCKKMLDKWKEPVHG